MAEIDPDWARFILDATKTAGSCIKAFVEKKAQSKKAAVDSSSSQSESIHVVTSQKCVSDSCEKLAEPCQRQSQVIIGRADKAVVIASAPAEPPGMVMMTNADVPANREDNRAILTALAEEDHRIPERGFPSFVAGYEEEVAMKRIGKEGDAE